MCFLWLSEETLAFALYIINSVVFITEVESVYFAVYTESLYKADTSRPSRVTTLYLFVKYIEVRHPCCVSKITKYTVET
jgi:hypothetical protein